MRLKTNSGKEKGKAKGSDAQVLKDIKAMKESLQQGDTPDLICEVAGNTGIQAVLPVYLDFFVNRNISEIVDGEYTVFGKVVKLISHDEAFSLMRNTSFKLFSENALQHLFDNMYSTMPDGLTLPDPNTRIRGPALVVISTAIYA